jgi:hypothetical protein
MKLWMAFTPDHRSDPIGFVRAETEDEAYTIAMKKLGRAFVDSYGLLRQVSTKEKAVIVSKMKAEIKRMQRRIDNLNEILSSL